MVGSPLIPIPITEGSVLSWSAGIGSPSPVRKIWLPACSFLGRKYATIVPRKLRPVRVLTIPSNFWMNPRRVVFSPPFLGFVFEVKKHSGPPQCLGCLRA